MKKKEMTPPQVDAGRLNAGQLGLIRSLVGPVEPQQLAFVDCFTGNRGAAFIPAAGQCRYALTDRHTHPAYSFVLCTAGPLSVDGTAYPAEPEDPLLLVYSPDVPHREDPLEDFVRYTALFLDRGLFESVWSGLCGDRIPSWNSFVLRPGVSLVEAFRIYLAECAGGAPGQQQAAAALEEWLACRLVRLLAGFGEQDLPGCGRAGIERVLELLHTRYGEQWQIEPLAAAAYLSPSQFSREFRRATGRTPHRYLKELRLEKARKQLLSGELSVTEIALRCGFSSSAHFSASFREHFGCAPSQYCTKPR